jgi:hypothetical protein
MSSPILVVLMPPRGIVANKTIVVGPRDATQCGENRLIFSYAEATSRPWA